MRGLARLQARLLVTVFCCAVCGVVGTASGAATPKAASQPGAWTPRRENAGVTQRIHAAILGLYALDSRLESVQAQIASLGAQRERIARKQRSLRAVLHASRHNLHTSRRQVALLVHTLYEQQTNDPLAVMLGAKSLEQAITTLDELGRAAREHEQIAARSRQALTSLRAATRALAREDARIKGLVDAASKAAEDMAAAEASRRHYISTLSAQRNLNNAQIARIDATARASAATGIKLTKRAAPPDTTPAASTSPVAGLASAGGTVTVVATGYSANGTTATGVPVGWGTVAVDPSVIPLGSRMTIAGYGEGIAADTGSAVQGTAIDLWFPTVRQALAWGRRVVTVTLH